MTVKGTMPALYRQLKKLPWARIPATSSVSTGHGRRARRTIKAALAPAWTGSAGAAQVAQLRRTVTKKGRKTVEVVYLITSDRAAGPAAPSRPRWRRPDRVRRRRPGRAAAPHCHEKGQEDRRGRLRHHQRPRRRSRHPGRLGQRPLGNREQAPLGPRRHLPGRQIPGQDRERAPRHGVPAQLGRQPPAAGRARQHRRRQPPPRPRSPADAQATSSCVNATLPYPWVGVCAN